MHLIIHCADTETKSTVHKDVTTISIPPHLSPVSYFFLRFPFSFLALVRAGLGGVLDISSLRLRSVTQVVSA